VNLGVLPGGKPFVLLVMDLVQHPVAAVCQADGLWVINDRVCEPWNAHPVLFGEVETVAADHAHDSIAGEKHPHPVVG
jgi:hypothetical protein